jgi:hypothetical protein
MATIRERREPKIVRQKMPPRGGTITQVVKPGGTKQRLVEHRFAPRPKTLPPRGIRERVALGQLEDPVAAGLPRATTAWHQYQANVKYDRNAVYVYLQAVFDVVQDWGRLGKASEYSLEALKRHEFSIRMNADPYARMIYCTSAEDDPKKRSKWARIMEWVATHNRRGRSFTEFVKNNGGLNECAENAAHDWLPKWT